MEVELVDSAPAPVEPVAPSPESNPQEVPADGGNAGVPAAEVAGTEGGEAAPVVEEQTTETLYELPDGRKVDAVTLQREWKENFYPEFTRKSQRLAEYERVSQPNLNNQPDVPEWKKPDYVPKSYAELIEIAETRAIERLTETARAEEARRAEVAAEVDNTVAALKSKDPKLDENALFAHANKYGFTDLTRAYENMSEMRKVAMTVEQRTVQNLNQRKADPVAGGGAPAPAVTDSIEYGNTGKYSGALEYLRSIQK